MATRLIDCEFCAGAGKQIYPSVLSQLAIQLARREFGINRAAKLPPVAPERSLGLLHLRWQDGACVVRDSSIVPDIAAAALLSPLAVIPQY
ncbi:hypothetical protein [Microcoleus sp. F4-D5]|uniref:hypothetical protein n=1 Tax=Microcoleus sp. F4-D5 TaxID=2818760 RepID=UPI002FD3EAE5